MNWKDVLINTGIIVIGIGATVLTSGLGAPISMAIGGAAAGGLSSGYSSYKAGKDAFGIVADTFSGAVKGAVAGYIGGHVAGVSSKFATKMTQGIANPIMQKVTHSVVKTTTDAALDTMIDGVVGNEVNSQTFLLNLGFNVGTNLVGKAVQKKVSKVKNISNGAQQLELPGPDPNALKLEAPKQPVNQNVFGKYQPNRILPRDIHGVPIPDVDRPHTQIGMKSGRREVYTQAREWNYVTPNNVDVIRDIDFTDHGRPLNHHNPHQHDYVDNRTGGTRKRTNERKLELP